MHMDRRCRGEGEAREAETEGTYPSERDCYKKKSQSLAPVIAAIEMKLTVYFCLDDGVRLLVAKSARHDFGAASKFHLGRQGGVDGFLGSVGKLQAQVEDRKRRGR